MIWVIMTLSFFLMRMAPGGPFDSDKRLPEAVEQNLWKTYGMAETLHADSGGLVGEVLVSPALTLVTNRLPLRGGLSAPGRTRPKDTILRENPTSSRKPSSMF